MIKQALLQQRTSLTRALVSQRIPRSSVVLLNNSRYKHTIVDSAKETLSALNKKIGEVAAAGIDKASEASETVKDQDLTGKAKETLNDVNMKVGKLAASGIGSAQDAVNSMSAEDVKSAASDLKDDASKKAKDLKDNTSEKAQEMTDKAADKAQEVTDKAADKAGSAADGVKSTMEDAKYAAQVGMEHDIKDAESLKDKAQDSWNKVKSAAQDIVDDDLKLYGSSTESEPLSNETSSKESPEVKASHKGYKSLQHKGKEAYTEQNRPEDFM